MLLWLHFLFREHLALSAPLKIVIIALQALHYENWEKDNLDVLIAAIALTLTSVFSNMSKISESR